MNSDRYHQLTEIGVIEVLTISTGWLFKSPAGFGEFRLSMYITIKATTTITRIGIKMLKEITKARPFAGLEVVVVVKSFDDGLPLSSVDIELPFVGIAVSLPVVFIVVEVDVGRGGSPLKNSLMGSVVCGRYRRLFRIKLKPRYR